MWKVEYTKSFLKELLDPPDNVQSRGETIVFDELKLDISPAVETELTEGAAITISDDSVHIREFPIRRSDVLLHLYRVVFRR